MAGRTWILLIGALLILLGIGYLGRGEIPQGPAGAGFPSEFPPLEGSLAHFGALFMIVSGVVFIVIAARKKPSDHRDGNHE
jgi:hypothetical protein